MSSTTLIRCNTCREWFEEVYHECPECNCPRPGFNKWLRTAKLNENLYDHARSADKEARFARSRGIG